MDNTDETQLLLSTFSLQGGIAAATVAKSTATCIINLANEGGLLAPAQGDSGAAAYFGGLRRRVAGLLQQSARSAAVQLLQAGARCLEGFVQINLCGPIQEKQVPLWQAANSAQPSSQAAAGLGQDSLSPDERWVVQQLEVDGEELLGRVQGLDLLLAALLCLAEPCGHLTTTTQQQEQQGPAAEASSNSNSSSNSRQVEPAWLQQQQLGSWCWWAMRAVMLQQHVLRGKSNTLQKCLKELIPQTLEWADSLQQQHPVAPGGSTSSSNAAHQLLPAAAHLECALVHQHYGHVADAQQQLEQATAVLGVEVQLTGALGFRTKHQLDPKAQLVASVKGAAAAAAAAPAAEVDGVEVSELGFDEVGLTKELEGMEDSSAVYLAPRLATDSTADGSNAAAAAAGAAGGSPSSNGPAAAEGSSSSSGSSNAAASQLLGTQRVSCMLQALLLGWAAQIKKGTSQDELQQWQMAPFVEAVLQQQRSHYMLHATARLLKCRHERERGRTRERSLMQLEQLCNTLEAGQPGAAVRIPYCFAVRFPLWPLLRKELAELYIGMGFVGAALRIFESLEMWDQLILCYRLLDKKQVAQELVLQRLQVTPDDAKLWCALGDIQQQEQHYIKAWEVSRHRSSRAQRSIGRMALQKKEYEKAAAAYELALGLNPLYPDAWFALGYCYLRLDENSKALQAFTKVTHLEADHGEAWTNLAGLWLAQGGWREALHASEQAVKYKRDSWQTWDNYASAAAKAHVMPACVRALTQVFELTNGQHLPYETAGQLLGQLEQEQLQLQQSAASGSVGDSSGAAGTAAAGTADDPEAGEDVMEAPEQLLSLLAVSAGLPDSNSSGSGADAAATSAAAAAARQRSYDQVLSALAALLKSVANAPACSPALWGLLGRLYGLQGQLLSSQEAWLKQVRALQSTPFKSDPEAFATMAAASDKLCRAYLASAAAGQGGLRELSAARMHLRGLLKQCEVAFEEQKQYQELQTLLQEVLAAEEAALAAKKAAEVTLE